MENDFGVKAVDSPAAQCYGLAAKAKQRVHEDWVNVGQGN
jgi:hypothetical protein